MKLVLPYPDSPESILGNYTDMDGKPLCSSGLRHPVCSNIVKNLFWLNGRWETQGFGKVTVFSFWVQNGSQWWLTSVIPALGCLRQEDCHKFKATLHYRVRSCFKNPEQTTPTNPHNNERLSSTKITSLRGVKRDWLFPSQPHTSFFMDVFGNIESSKIRNKEKGWLL